MRVKTVSSEEGTLAHRANMKKRGCVCGNPTKKPHTRAFIEALSKLRGYRVKVCPLCGHEIGPIRKAHDVRKLSAFGHTFAHRACVKAYGLKPRLATVNHMEIHDE